MNFAAAARRHPRKEVSITDFRVRCIFSLMATATFPQIVAPKINNEHFSPARVCLPLNRTSPDGKRKWCSTKHTIINYFVVVCKCSILLGYQSNDYNSWKIKAITHRSYSRSYFSNNLCTLTQVFVWKEAVNNVNFISKQPPLILNVQSSDSVIHFIH